MTTDISLPDGWKREGDADDYWFETVFEIKELIIFVSVSRTDDETPWTVSVSSEYTEWWLVAEEANQLSGILAEAAVLANALNAEVTS